VLVVERDGGDGVLPAEGRLLEAGQSRSRLRVVTEVIDVGLLAVRLEDAERRIVPLLTPERKEGVGNLVALRGPGEQFPVPEPAPGIQRYVSRPDPAKRERDLGVGSRELPSPPAELAGVT
jgi:hypothetical protein